MTWRGFGAAAPRDARRGGAPGEASGKILVLELARFLAAFWVTGLHLVSEVLAIAKFPPSSLPVLNHLFFGAAPVTFFFVLSGFVMYMAHHTHFGQIGRLPHYLLNRAARIYPLYWASAILSIVIFGLATGGWGLPKHPFWVAILLPNQDPLHTIEGNPVAWTLRFEVTFYAVFALLLVPRIGALLFALWLLLPVWAVYPTHPPGTWLSALTGSNTVLWPEWLYSHLANGACFDFVAGMAGGWIYRRIRPRAALALGLLGLATVLLGWEIVRDHWGMGYPSDQTKPFFASIYAFWIVAAAACERAGAFPRIRGFARLGAFSYPIYLMHSCVMLGFTFAAAAHPRFIHAVPAIVWFAGLLGASFALSWVSMLADTPLQRGIRRLRWAPVGRLLRLFGARLPAPHPKAERALLAFAFVFLVVPLALRLAILIPPGWMADEPAHAIRAEALSHGALVGSRKPVDDPAEGRVVSSGIKADPAMVWTTITPPLTPPFAEATIEKHKNFLWYGHTQFLQIGPISGYAPVFYAPAAAAFALARLRPLSPWHAYRLARLADTLAFAILGLAALLVAERGRALLFVTLAMPETVALAASLNPDGLLIPMAALGAALLTGAAPWGAPSRRRRAGLAALALVAMVKPAYLPLLLLGALPLPPWRDFAAWRPRIGAVALAALPAVLWFGYTSLFVSTMSHYAPGPAGPLWPGTPGAPFAGPGLGAQLRVVLAHPGPVLHLLWRGLADPYVRQQFVGELGWNNLFLPDWAYHAWDAALALAGIGVLLAGGARTRARDAATVLAGIVLSVVLILVWLYLTWTTVGNSVLQGLQGRYLLPVLPALALLGFAPAFLPEKARLIGRAGIACALAGLAAVMLTSLPMTVAAALL